MAGGMQRWDGVSIHDLNDDGKPEVLSSGEVFDGKTGIKLNTGQIILKTGTGVISVVTDIDQDGVAELIADKVYSWNPASNPPKWEEKSVGASSIVGTSLRHFAVADFGTPGAEAKDFDAKTLDGIPEIAVVGGGEVSLSTLDGQIIFTASVGGGQGGPPTIGDFDNDGFPEIAEAAADFYRVFDLDCPTGGEMGCAGLPYVRWSQASQDGSSNRTGSSIFDFEGDGKAEAVYADECFTRIYDGNTGQVLYSSYRTSCTWYENPVVADVDRDDNSEIVVGSNENCDVTCPLIDPIHPGQRCSEDAECGSGNCEDSLCRCTDDAQCANDDVCVSPIDGSDSLGNVCRATHPANVKQTGVRVLKDSLDRWASSRPMWNQHAYSITNINDDGTVPKTSEWSQNYDTAGLNNYRQNAQGDAGSTDFPDITGRLGASDICKKDGGTVQLEATVCNRGTKGVGADMPATFYRGLPADGDILCVSYTDGAVPVGGCRTVTCLIAEDVSNETITMVVNDDGEGNRTTLECNDLNNTDSVTVGVCKDAIIR